MKQIQAQSATAYRKRVLRRRARQADEQQLTHEGIHTHVAHPTQVGAPQTQRLPREERHTLVSNAAEIVGNRQVQKQLLTGLAQRSPGNGETGTGALPATVPEMKARTPQQLNALIDRVVHAIVQHESGGEAKESRMKTSAGVAASLASQVQATMPWILTALLKLNEDTLKREFNLTRKELKSAEKRVIAAGTLWDAVHKSDASTTLESFLADKKNQALLTQSGLSAEEVGRMFAFRALRQEITTAYTTALQEVQGLSSQELLDRSTARDRQKAGIKKSVPASGNKRTKLIQAIARRETSTQFAGQPEATALGINESSLDAYLRANWREDRAAWTRIAANREPVGEDQSVGERIEAAATADEGLKLGHERIAQIVQGYVAQHPQATDNEVCSYTAHQHNPGGGKAYTNKVMTHFQ